MEPQALEAIADLSSLAQVRMAVIDVETSGLSPQDHHLLQIAVVHVDGTGGVTSRWASDVRPPRGLFGRVGPRHVHGLSRHRLWRAPRLPQVLTTLGALLADTVVVGHNIQFDLAFLHEASRRVGVPLPENPSLCTLMLSRQLDPDRRRRHRLGDLCTYYGISLERPHDALADAEATATLLSRLLTTLDVHQPEDLAALIRAQVSP
jgi:DNA polymerase III epsilon subunit-like protein